ncbi:hypothetical protein BC937DRAFT_87238 [Endogone sp. FLAS-F59071]|nr:hypothetical protein BC937DRAFT_87238 [Endogone sp. FLAS-F59071]|eukprot:RUS19586.1 hypothetical protein BC937DRAFT_87238 [Endogone sp. FLAS-F59071]
MEAIDDYANETIIRSLALTALTHRKQQNYSPLLAISSYILQQRLHYLNPSLATPSAWDTALQWQPDGSAEALRTLWNDKDDAKDELLQAEVRYRRLDLETLHAMIEFAHGDGGVRYVVVMMLEEGGEVQEWKYHNTREIGKDEWEGEVTKEWSNTLEEAEKRFVLGVAAKRNILDGKKTEKPKRISVQAAPDDYWGAWSDDEDSSKNFAKAKHLPVNSTVKNDSDADSDGDDYWDQFAAAPGTLTPGPNDTPPARGGRARTLQSHTALHRSRHDQAQAQPLTSSATTTPTQAVPFPHPVAAEPTVFEREEMQEEYDITYNPLHIVPSVTNMSELQAAAALSELTNILHKSLPANPKRASAVAPAENDAVAQAQVSNGTAVVPEIVYDVPATRATLPGKWPDETIANGAVATLDPNAEAAFQMRPNSTVGFIFDKLTSSLSNAIPFGGGNTTSDPLAAPNGASAAQREAFRPVLMQALRGIIGMARLAGFEGWEVVEIVKQAITEQA